MPMTNQARQIRLLVDRLRWLHLNKSGMVETVLEYEKLMPEIIAKLDQAVTLAEELKESDNG